MKWSHGVLAFLKVGVCQEAGHAAGLCVSGLAEGDMIDSLWLGLKARSIQCYCTKKAWLGSQAVLA